jgi:formate hydrogenlyase transcriptional activator
MAAPKTPVVNISHQHPTVGEGYLRLIVDTIPALLVSALPDGSVEFINKGWRDYTGVALENLTGCGWYSTVHPDDLERFSKEWDAARAIGKPFENQARIRRYDGEYRWFLIRKTPLRNASGDIVRWYGAGHDIEELKRTEAEARRSEFYLAEGERLAHTGSWAFNPSGFFYHWSRELFEIYGLDPASKAPTLEAYLSLIHPDDRKFMAQLIEQLVAEHLGCDVKKRIVRPNGEIRYIRCVGLPVVRDGVFTELVGTAIDVTEQELLTQELQRRQAYLTEAQRLSQTGSFGWRPDSGEIVWSDETYRIFEYDHAVKPTLDSVVQRVHPEDRADFLRVIDSVLKGATHFEHTYRWLLPDGRVKHVHALAHALQDASGNREFVGAATDVTSIKTAEEELRKSEAYLAEAQRLTHMGSWAWQVAGKEALHLSDEWYRIYGFDPKQGMPSWEERLQRVHPEDRNVWEGVIERAIREKSDYEVEFRTVFPDGTLKWVHTVGHPVLSPSGELDQFVGSSMDITERKRAENKIREQEMELRQMLDFAPQIVAVFGPRRERLYANRMTLDYLGVTLDEWRQRGLGAEAHPDDSERLKAHIDRAVSSGSGFELELRLRKGDGNYRWFLARYNPVRDEQGRVTRWYAACTDIDDRKRVEETLRNENILLREEIDRSSMFEEIVGASPALQAVLSRVSKVARTDSTVLITGETGTGKELIARALHKRSARSERAFVSINCAAIPQSLLASELFGYEKGAFTGALQRHLGRFELAEGGTIFLDEVGELPGETQIALLRVLQEREFERVGGHQRVRADIRVIAATNRDLETAIAGGDFRSDLYYRLNVFPISVPPLRERKEDIPMLVEYFVDRYASKAGKKIRGINRKTMDRLKTYSWPGNIRELQNVIERSVILCDMDEFSVDESWLSRESTIIPINTKPPLTQKLASQEKKIIEAALANSKGRVSGPSGAAAELGIPASTLESKIKALNINKRRFA